MIFFVFFKHFILSHPPFFPNPICDKFNSGPEFPWLLFFLLLQLTRKSSWGKAGILAGPRGPWSNFSYLFSESTVCNFSVIRMFSQSATQATRTKNVCIIAYGISALECMGFNHQCSCRMVYKNYFKFSRSRLFLKYS